MPSYRSDYDEFGLTPYNPNDFSFESSAPEEEDDRWEVTKGFSAGIDQIQAIGGGLAGVVGDVVGSDRLRDWGLEVYQSNIEESKQSQARIGSYDQIESAGDAFDYVMFGLGNALPMFAPSVVSGGVGAIAARKAAQIAVKKLVESKVKKGLATGFTEEAAAKLAAKEGALMLKASVRGRGIGAAAGSIGLETGSIYGEVFEETGEHRAGVALSFGAMAGLLDAIPIGKALNRFSKKGRDEVVKEVLDGAGTFLGKQILREATTEGLQTILERSAIKWVDDNKEVFGEEGWNEITNAALLGGIAGGFYSIPAAPRGRKKLNDEAKAKKKRKNNLNNISNDVNKSFEEVVGGELDMPSLDEIEQSANAPEFHIDEIDNPILDPNFSIDEIDSPEQNDPDALEEMLNDDLAEYSQLKSWDTDIDYLDKSEKNKQARALDLRNRIIETNAELDKINFPEGSVPLTSEAQILDSAEKQRDGNLKLQEQTKAIEDDESRRNLAINLVGASDPADDTSKSFGFVNLATAIRNAGGIKVSLAEADGLDPAGRKSLNSDSDFIGRPLFSENGLTPDEMREELDQWGWDAKTLDPGYIVQNAIESAGQSISLDPSAINWKLMREYIQESTGKTFTKYQLQKILSDFGNGHHLTAKETLAANAMIDIQLEEEAEIQARDFYGSEGDNVHSEEYAEWYKREHKNTYELIRKVAHLDPTGAEEIMADWEQGKTTDGEVTRFLTKFIEQNKEQFENETKNDSEPVQADSRQSNQGRQEAEPARSNEKSQQTNLKGDENAQDEQSSDARKSDRAEVSGTIGRRSDARQEDGNEVSGLSGGQLTDGQRQEQNESKDERLPEQLLRNAEARNTPAVEKKPNTFAIDSKAFTFKTLNELKVKARSYARKHFSGKKVTNNSDSSVIEISWKGIKKALSGNPTRNSIFASYQLDKLIENGKFQKSEKDKLGRKDIKAIHHYLSEVSIDGKNVEFRVVVRENIDGKRYYDHSEITNLTPSGTEPFKVGGEAVDSIIAETNEKVEDQQVANTPKDTKSENTGMPELINVGMTSFKPKPIGGKLYRETNMEGLSDLIRDSQSNNQYQGSVASLFVTNDESIALGQGTNKGVSIVFNGDLVSGKENNKPGTGIEGVTGKEYKTDYINKDSIESFVVPKGLALKGVSKVFANRIFDKSSDADGNTVYTKKGLALPAKEVKKDESKKPELDLKSETEMERLDREIEETAKKTKQEATDKAAKQKVEADKEANDFVLTGSDSAVDKAEARGQVSLLDQNNFDDKSEFGKYKTGKSLSINFAKNNEKAPIVDGMGQEIEPDGDYLVVQESEFTNPIDGWLYGVIDFKNPLVLEFKSTNSTGWKKDLSIMFDGKTGKELSKAVKTAGYDGILTVEKYRNKWSLNEAVNLSAKKQTAKNKKDAVKLENFGEKLGGSRKDKAKSFIKDLSDDDIRKLPLSKLWNIKEIEKIEDATLAAFGKAFRDEIPNKPRTGLRLVGWIKTVRSALKAFNLVSGIVETSGVDLIELMEGSKAKAPANIVSKVKLLRKIDRKHWGRIGEVQEHPDSMSTDEKGVEFKDPVISVRIDKAGKFFSGESVDSAVDEIVDYLDGSKVSAKRVKFEIRYHFSDKSYAINKSGDTEYRILAEFPVKPTEKKRDALVRARKHLNDNYEEVLNAWSAVKERDNVSKKDTRGKHERDRVGADHRKGKDVTEQQFDSAFGFRGTEFGEWVKHSGSKSRQSLLNKTYDGLMDLANLLDIPSRAISLNGKLGLGLGSRGSGNASAHFEAGELVINLTKTKGSGSLAHEWFHALDNHFMRARTDGDIPKSSANKDHFITYRPEPMMVRKGNYYGNAITKERFDKGSKKHPDFYNLDSWELDKSHPEGVRPVVEKSFGDLVKTLNDSPMHDRSLIITKGKEEGYWSQIIERGARSFEGYVIYKMEKQGGHNDFLVNVTQPGSFKRSLERYPYLLNEEIKPVADAFDKLFKTLKTRETDKGVELYRTGVNKKSELKPEHIDKFSGRIANAFAGSPVSVVQSENDLPVEIRTQIARDGKTGRVKGLFHNGNIYIIGGNHKTIADMQRTALHETVGHYGLKQWLGDEHAGFIEKVYSLMNEVQRLRVARDNGLSKNMDNYETKMAEEYIAKMAEKGQNPTIIEKIIGWFKEAISKLFPNIKVSDGDIRIALAKTRKMLVNKAKSLNEVELSRTATRNGEKVTMIGTADNVLRVAMKKLETANNLLRCVNA